MKIVQAKAEARAVKRKKGEFPDGHHSVEQLNPRGQIVKQMEMTVRRCQALGNLCRMHLDIYGGDKESARRDPPATWGSLDIRTMRKEGFKEAINPRKALREVFGEHWWNHPEFRAWTTTFDSWLNGSLERQERALIANLPEAIRKKYQ